MTILINVTMSSTEVQFSINLDSLLAMVAGAMIVITVLLLSILVICLRHLRQSFELSQERQAVPGHQTIWSMVMQMGHLLVYFHKALICEGKNINNMLLFRQKTFYASVV